MIRKLFYTVVIALIVTNYTSAQSNLLNATKVEQIGKQSKEKIAADEGKGSVGKTPGQKWVGRKTKSPVSPTQFGAEREWHKLSHRPQYHPKERSLTRNSMERLKWQDGLR